MLKVNRLKIIKLKESATLLYLELETVGGRGTWDLLYIGPRDQGPGMN